MKNTGQLETEIRARIQEVKDKKFFEKIGNLLIELEKKHFANVVIKEGSEHMCCTWNFEFITKMKPEMKIKIHYRDGGYRCRPMSMFLDFNNIRVFAVGSNS